MPKRDYYDILGVDRSASQGEIKKAYRKIALKFHPDKNQGDATAEDKFKEAAEAYEILSHQEKKDRYDQFGHQGVNGGGGFTGGGMTMEDIFSQFGDIFGRTGSPFESFFGGGGRTRTRGRRGSNLRIKLHLSLEEIAHGAEKKIKVNRMVTAEGLSFSPCHTCQGIGQIRKVVNTMLGQMSTATTCHMCSGTGKIIDHKPPGADSTGRIIKEEIITINIPAGVSEGMQLSMSGKGNDGPQEGPPGDLLILIEEEEHKFLKREGNNLVFDLYVSFIDAALGTSLEVPTIDGKVKIKLEPGTQGGKILRLRGKGIVDLDGYNKGDQLIYISIWTPKKLTTEEKSILENLRSSQNFVPNPGKNEKGFFERMKEFF
ncbi:MAG: molecular chaperone DnaJ [Bacteroidetes bacterium]|nr:molecular chaperone DnaJ [Bacteroidota bacterium]